MFRFEAGTAVENVEAGTFYFGLLEEEKGGTESLAVLEWFLTKLMNLH